MDRPPQETGMKSKSSSNLDPETNHSPEARNTEAANERTKSAGSPTAGRRPRAVPDGDPGQENGARSRRRWRTPPEPGQRHTTHRICSKTHTCFARRYN